MQSGGAKKKRRRRQGVREDDKVIGRRQPASWKLFKHKKTRSNSNGIHVILLSVLQKRTSHNRTKFRGTCT